MPNKKATMHSVPKPPTSPSPTKRMLPGIDIPPRGQPSSDVPAVQSLTQYELGSAPASNPPSEGPRSACVQFCMSVPCRFRAVNTKLHRTSGVRCHLPRSKVYGTTLRSVFESHSLRQLIYNQ